VIHRQPSPIGLDIGPRLIHAVQLDAGRSRITAALALSRAGTAFDGAEAARLESILYRNGFVGRGVVACVPDGKLVTAVLELPPRSSGAPLEQLARVEVARVHKLDPASFEMECWDVPSPARAGDATHMMAAACANSEATALLDAIESVGLRVHSLDIKPWALTRACGAALGAVGSGVILDVAEHGALLTAVREGCPVYERLMQESGTTALREALKRELGADEAVADFLMDSLLSGGEFAAEASARDAALRLTREHIDHLRQEVATALDYLTHRYPGPVPALALTGAGAALPGLAACLERGAEHAVKRFSARELANCPEFLTVCQGSGLITALGLAKFPMRRAA
jgi:Tfp pilus assembly PilM family ATPase